MLDLHWPSPPGALLWQTGSWVLSFLPCSLKVHHSALRGSVLPKEVLCWNVGRRTQLPLLLLTAMSAQSRGIMEAGSSGGFGSQSRRGWDCEAIDREDGRVAWEVSGTIYCSEASPRPHLCIAPAACLFQNILKQLSTSEPEVFRETTSTATPCRQVVNFSCQYCYENTVMSIIYSRTLFLA